MKLKRIRKLEYNDKEEPDITDMERLMYDVHFIDNEDWLCIDEEDYTEAKKGARNKERTKKLMKRYAETSGLPMPTVVYYSKVDVAESVKISQTVYTMITIDSL